MKVRPGYKLTEVGVVPEEWGAVQLHSLVKRHNSGVYKKSELYGHGCNIVGVSDIYAIDSIDGQRFSEVPLSSAEQAKHTLQAHDLLYGESSLVREGIARTVHVTERGAGTAFAWHTRRYAVDQKALLSSYAYYFLQSRLARKHMMDQAIQTAITGINTVAYFACPVLVPPLPEQRAIAAALSDVDTLQGGLERLIAKKRDLKQAAMQQLLTGQTRLPGFHGEWEVNRLGELLSYEQPTKYLVKSSEYSDANDIPVLTAGKTFILGYTNEDDGVFSNLPVIIFDDFTTATKYVTFPFKAKSSAMKLLKPRNASVNLRLVYEMMQLIEFKLSEHKRYWISEFQQLEVKMPDEREQTAIAAALSDMDAELSALESRRDKTRALKQAMMQELLTGRTRLV